MSKPLTIHYNVMYGTASGARDACILKALDTEYQDYRECLTAIVFSAMTLESYINEMTYSADHHLAHMRNFNIIPPWAGLDRFVNRMNGMVRDRWSADQKYLEACYLVTGELVDKGSTPFQDLRSLFQLRNWVAHTTPELSSKLAIHFDALGLLRQPEPTDSGTAWISDLSSVQTPAMASWACRTTRQTIEYMSRLAPPEMPNLFTGLYYARL